MTDKPHAPPEASPAPRGAPSAATLAPQPRRTLPLSSCGWQAAEEAAPVPLGCLRLPGGCQWARPTLVPCPCCLGCLSRRKRRAVSVCGQQEAAPVACAPEQATHHNCLWIHCLLPGQASQGMGSQLSAEAQPSNPSGTWRGQEGKGPLHECPIVARTYLGRFRSRGAKNPSPPPRFRQVCLDFWHRRPGRVRRGTCHLAQRKTGAPALPEPVPGQDR